MTDMTEKKEDRCTHKARGEGKMKKQLKGTA
jgi:hypothetical protein